MKDTEYAAKKRKRRQVLLRQRKPRRQGSRAVIGKKLPMTIPAACLPNHRRGKGE